MTDPIRLDDATALLTQVAAGRATPEQVASAVRARAEEIRKLNAFVEPELTGILERAAGSPAGPLRGLPLAVKDCFDTEQLPTGAGTPALTGRRTRRDAGVVARLRAAGAFVAGKTTLHELSFGITSHNAWTGAVRNPVDPSLIPGGSSGGTAVAVAAGVVPVGLAGDTGGSARLPAALCGVVGFRPTHGRYPADGAVPVSGTRDTPGLIGRTVADVALLDGVLAGAGTGAGTGADPAMPLAGLRLGLPTTFWSGLDPEVERVSIAARDVVEAAGVVLVEVALDEVSSLADALAFPLCQAEFGGDLAAYLAREDDGVTVAQVCGQIRSPDVVKSVALCLPGLDEAAHARLLLARAELRARYAALLADAGVAALIFPTSPLPARPIGEDVRVELRGRSVPTFASYTRHLALAGVAGHPGISVPAGRTLAGLPVGIELDGPVGGDRSLLALAGAVAAVLAG